MTTANKKEYWLHKSSSEVVDHLDEVDARESNWSTSPIRQAWVRNYIAYYSPALSTNSWETSLIFDGVQGELTRFYTPKSRSLIQQLVTLITKQRLSFQCMAETEGSDVIQDVKLGNALADQIIENERLNLKYRELVEGALVCGAWFTKTTWRTDKGKPYTRGENGAVIYTGGVDISLHSVFDVCYDTNLAHWEQLNWVKVRSIKNRYDLVAQHPETEKELLALPSIYETRGPNSWFDRGKVDNDSVFIHELFAKPSPALPQGRMLVYGSNECVLYDKENPYEGIPVECMMPEKVLGTGMGYAPFTSLAASQEMYDNSLSAISTNQAQFAVQTVAVPRSAGIQVSELGGMKFCFYTPQNIPGGGLPTPLQLTQSSPETFKFAEMLDKCMMDLSGINPSLRGAPPAGVTSGVAIATLSANAMEFIDGVALSGLLCIEHTMEHALNNYKRFAKLDQSVAMQGKNNQSQSRKFNKDNLKCFSGVKIQQSNPLMRTIAGRLEVAEKLLSMPKEIWPEYTSVLEGRPLTEIYKGELSQQDLIYSENEMLMQGQGVPVLATDDHAKHIQQHAGLLNDPNVRMNGSSNQVILDHMMQHQQQAQSVDPMLMAMVRTGKMPEMPPPMLGGPPQGPPGPPHPGGPPGPHESPHGEPPHSGPTPSSKIEGMPTEKVAAPARDLLNRQQPGVP